MRRKIFTITSAIIATALVLFAIVSPKFSIENQTKVVGTEVENPCDGIIGYKEVMYTTESSSSFEGLAHYRTKCLNGVEVGE